MNINYDWYKIFCCVAEHENITLASEKLFISQPAVSQSISRLEETIGCALFLRTPKGVKLTAEGRVLYQYAAAGIAAFSEGERRLTAMLRLDVGEIRIGASDMTLEFCLLPYLEAFHKKYPNITIAITNHPTPQTLELLRRGEIDFAAVSGPPRAFDPIRKQYKHKAVVGYGISPTRIHGDAQIRVGNQFADRQFRGTEHGGRMRCVRFR